ncbi:hypothetical protein V8B97DRAFT_1223621 [Scleroderma yunnanense]
MFVLLEKLTIGTSWNAGNNSDDQRDYVPLCERITIYLLLSTSAGTVVSPPADCSRATMQVTMVIGGIPSQDETISTPIQPTLLSYLLAIEVSGELQLHQACNTPMQPEQITGSTTTLLTAILSSDHPHPQFKDNISMLERRLVDHRQGESLSKGMHLHPVGDGLVIRLQEQSTVSLVSGSLTYRVLLCLSTLRLLTVTCMTYCSRSIISTYIAQ